MKENRSILVTGGLGYIGSHTVVELINEGFEVTIVDDLSNSEIFILDRILAITGKKPKFYEFDLKDFEKTSNCFHKNDFNAVIHFAAFKSVSESIIFPQKYFDNNIRSIENILTSMKTYGTKKIVFSSSCTVYGQPDQLPVNESAPFKNPASPYGETKQICEARIKDFISSNDGFFGISLRYFNPVGAHHSALIGELPLGAPENLVPYITQTAIGKRDQLNVFGNDYNTHDGTAIRDYIHIEDLSKAHVAALNRLIEVDVLDNFYEYYNVGSGKGYSVMDVIKSFEKVSNLKLDYKITDRREGDIEKIYSDTNLSKKKLNWSSQKKLDDMMISAWNWEKELNKNL